MSNKKTQTLGEGFKITSAPLVNYFLYTTEQDQSLGDFLAKGIMASGQSDEYPAHFKSPLAFDFEESHDPDDKVSPEMNGRIVFAKIPQNHRLVIPPSSQHLILLPTTGKLENTRGSLSTEQIGYNPPGNIYDAFATEDTHLLFLNLEDRPGSTPVTEYGTDRFSVIDLDNLNWDKRPGKEAYICYLPKQFNFKSNPDLEKRVKLLRFPPEQIIHEHQHPMTLTKFELTGRISYQDEKENITPNLMSIVKKYTKYHGRAEGPGNSDMLLLHMTR